MAERNKEKEVRSRSLAAVRKKRDRVRDDGEKMKSGEAREVPRSREPIRDAEGGLRSG